MERTLTRKIRPLVADGTGSPKEPNTTNEHSYAYTKTVVAWETNQPLTNNPDKGTCFTDFFAAYGQVLPQEQYRSCAKQDGETNHPPKGHPKDSTLRFDKA